MPEKIHIQQHRASNFSFFCLTLVHLPLLRFLPTKNDGVMVAGSLTTDPFCPMKRWTAACFDFFALRFPFVWTVAVFEVFCFRCRFLLNGAGNGCTDVFTGDVGDDAWFIDFC